MLDFNPPLIVQPDPPDVSFLRAMAEHGLSPGKILPDGTLTRFDVESRGDQVGWYVFYSDGPCPAGCFGNWRTGLNKTWSHKSEAEMSAAEIEGFRRHVEAMKAKRQAEAEKRHAEAKGEAERIWSASTTAPDDHPYLIEKGVQSYGLKVASDGRLVVPIFDINNDLHSLQYIGDKKRFLLGGAIKGNFFTIPGNKTVYICEGYATGATVHEATGGTIIVVLNAGNLLPVAQEILKKFPNASITICGDDDRFTDSNPGRKKAEAAAEAIGATVVFPEFKNLSTRPTDFNDLVLLEGVEVVKGLIEGKAKGSNFEFIHNDELIRNLKPITWTVAGLVVENSLFYTFGDPGCHKTFVELDRGLSIAAGIPFHGHRTRQGTVFFICGEGQQGIGRRIAAWHIAHKTRAKDVPFFISMTPMQLSDPTNVENVMRAIEAMAKKYGAPGAVIIDTLARNFGNGDENSTKDMSIVIQNLDRYFGNDFCRGLLHHTGHNNKQRGRGSIVLKGAVDSEFRLSMTGNDQILLECIKQKDAQKADPMLFNHREILLQIDGQKDSSLVLDLVAEGDAIKDTPEINLSSKMIAALDVLKKMGGDVSGVDYLEWRKRCIEKKTYGRTDVFDNAAKKMRANGVIGWDLLKRCVFVKNHRPLEPSGN
jgi:putative DNA primase/helicase